MCWQVFIILLCLLLVFLCFSLTPKQCLVLLHTLLHNLYYYTNIIHYYTMYQQNEFVIIKFCIARNVLGSKISNIRFLKVFLYVKTVVSYNLCHRFVCLLVTLIENWPLFTSRLCAHFKIIKAHPSYQKGVRTNNFVEK